MTATISDNIETRLASVRCAARHPCTRPHLESAHTQPTGPSEAGQPRRQHTIAQATPPGMPLPAPKLRKEELKAGGNLTKDGGGRASTARVRNYRCPRVESQAARTVTEQQQPWLVVE